MRLSLSKLLHSAVLLAVLFILAGVNGQCVGEPTCLGGDAFDAQQYYKQLLSTDGTWPCDGCIGGSCSMCGLTYIAEAVEDACSFLISRGCSLEARNYTARGVQSYDCNPVPYYCSTLNIDGCYDIDGCSWIGQPHRHGHPHPNPHPFICPHCHPRPHLSR